MTQNPDEVYKVVKWFKKDGDTIKAGEVLCEIETGKAVMELECYQDGYIYLRIRPKKSLKPNDFLCLISPKQLRIS